MLSIHFPSGWSSSTPPLDYEYLGHGEEARVEEVSLLAFASVQCRVCIQDVPNVFVAHLSTLGALDEVDDHIHAGTDRGIASARLKAILEKDFDHAASLRA